MATLPGPVRGAFPVLAVLLASCAGKQALPPGDELEMPPEKPSAAQVEAHQEQVANTLPKADQELQASFENPKAKKPVEVASDAGTFAPVVATPPPVSPPLPTDNELLRREVGPQLAAIKKAVAKRQYEQCAALEAVQALPEWPAEFQLQKELEAGCALGQGQGGVAKSLAWLKACGPDKVEGCRARAIGSLAASAQAKGADKAGIEAKVKELRKADTCLATAGASAEAGDSACVDEALGVYRKYGDELMKARVWLLRGRAAVAKKHPDPQTFFIKAEGECKEARCAGVRRQALMSLSRLAFASGDLETAASAVLREGALASATLPEAERTFTRSADAERICAAYDAKAGAGACRKLEKKLTGDYHFKDYSKARAKRGLSGNLVKEVNEHFNCLLQECLGLEAQRLTPPASETYEIRWAVLNDGKVGEVHLGRKEQEETPLAECVRRQFALWRYPRYDGEQQHVEQRFTVSARERR